METTKIQAKIGALCKEKGTSIKQLEKKCGFGNGSIAKAKTMSIERLQKIAQVLGVPLTSLYIDLMDEEEQKETALQNAFDMRPEMRTLFSVASGCTKEEIEQAIKVIEALKH